jgi:hypothetical protein
VIEIEDRHRELLRTLAGAEVQFVLVGGVALQLRGFSGATRDVDVTIAVDDLNTRRLGAAVGESRAADRKALDQQLERLRRLIARTSKSRHR